MINFDIILSSNVAILTSNFDDNELHSDDVVCVGWQSCGCQQDHMVTSIISTFRND